MEPVEERCLYSDLHDPRLVHATDAGVFEDAAVGLSLPGFLHHGRHIAGQKLVEGMGLRLLGGVG